MPPSHVGAVVAANRRSRGAAGGSCKSAQSSSRTSLLKDPPLPLKDEEVPSYVQPYGFSALGADQWQKLAAGAIWPKLNLTMLRHTEIEGHTLYQLKCELETPPSLCLKWSVHRRLVHLREGLHDFVQSSLGDGYDAVFGKAPFALRGGPPGTSARLQAWLQLLVLHVNDGSASPSTVAQVLNFFEVPKPPAGATARALLDFVDIPKPRAKVTAPFSADPNSPSSPVSRRGRPIGFSPLTDSPYERKVSFMESVNLPLDSPCKGHPAFTA